MGSSASASLLSTRYWEHWIVFLLGNDNCKKRKIVQINCLFSTNFGPPTTGTNTTTFVEKNGSTRWVAWSHWHWFYSKAKSPINLRDKISTNGFLQLILLRVLECTCVPKNCPSASLPRSGTYYRMVLTHISGGLVPFFVFVKMIFVHIIMGIITYKEVGNYKNILCTQFLLL